MSADVSDENKDVMTHFYYYIYLYFLFVFFFYYHQKMSNSLVAQVLVVSKKVFRKPEKTLILAKERGNQSRHIHICYCRLLRVLVSF